MDTIFDACNLSAHSTLLHSQSPSGQLLDEPVSYRTHSSHFVSTQLGDSSYFAPNSHSHSEPLNSNLVDEYSLLSSSTPELSRIDDFLHSELAQQINIPIRQPVPEQAAVYWSSAARGIQDSIQKTPTAADSGQSIQDALYRELYREPLDLSEPVDVSPGLLSSSPWTTSPGSPAWFSDGQQQQQHDTYGQLNRGGHFLEGIPCTSSPSAWAVPRLLQFEQEHQQFHGQSAVPPVSASLFGTDEDLHHYEFNHGLSYPSQFELRPIPSHHASPSSISISTQSSPSFNAPSPRQMVAAWQLQFDSGDLVGGGGGGGAESGSDRATESPQMNLLGSSLVLSTGIDQWAGSPDAEGAESPIDTTPVVHTDDAACKETDYLRRRCFNCHSIAPPSWRRSTLAPGKIVCNKCGLYERTHGRPRPHRFEELFQDCLPIPRPRPHSKNSTVVGAAPSGKAPRRSRPRQKKTWSPPSAASVSPPSVTSSLEDWNTHSAHPAPSATAIEFVGPFLTAPIRPPIYRSQTELAPPSATPTWSSSSDVAPSSSSSTAASRPMRRKTTQTTRPTELLARRGTFDAATLSAKKRALRREGPTDAYRHLLLQRPGAARDEEVVEVGTGWHHVKLGGMMSSFRACPAPPPTRKAMRSLSVGGV